MARCVANLIAAATLLAIAAGVTTARGQTAWYEGFEGPTPTWRDAGGNARYRIERHRREQGAAHTGDGCEHLSLRGDHGTFVHIGHDVGRARVIDELLPSVWVKSDRPGLQLAARLVLPRTADPRTGRPVATVVRGSSYTDIGRWQQLRIDDVRRLLMRRVRVLRTQLGPNVDGREAYVDAVLLNVYGGPGATNVWIDDLDIAGFVASPTKPRPAVAPAKSRPAVAPNQSQSPPDRGAGASAEARTAGASADGNASCARLVGSVLMAEGRPVFPRVIQHQGEPLEYLRRLGFNGVWLSAAPTAVQLAEANRLGLWLICPPPRPADAKLPDDPAAVPALIGPEYARVLAWDLGHGLSGDRLADTRRWAQWIRAADRRGGRPLIAQPVSDLRAYSRLLDLLLLDRRPLGTSLKLADWGEWIRRRPRLARPGTPIWTTIQTQLSPTVGRQLAALEPAAAAPHTAGIEQIRLLVYTAIGSASRGLLFASHSRLDASDPETRHRATTLELVNLDVQLIEPWAAGGDFQATAEGNRQGVIGAVLRSNRSRLLLPICSTPGAQFVPGGSPGGGLSLVVPGVPESSAAYHLVPGGLRPLRHKRVTGGMRVTLDEFALTDQVLLAQDPLVVASLTRRSQAIGSRAAALQRDLAVRKLDVVGHVLDQLAPQSTAVRSHPQLSAARKEIQWADGYLASRDYRAAYLYARRAMRSLRLLERAEWEAATAGLDSPLGIPPAVSFETLPRLRRWAERIRGSQLGPNRLAGGDFEDFHALVAAGWQHLRHTTPGVRTSADLVAGAAHSGFCGLRLVARAEDPQNPPSMLETAPVWITSPPVAVEAGQVVVIRGFVQISTAITGSVDRLMIVDSLGGEALALRVGQTAGWQPFALYRAAAQSGQVNVTFVLSGLGEVRLDDVTIQPLLPAAVTQRPRQRVLVTP